MQSELSKTIDVADVKAQYDAQCKRVLSQREILARILKEVAEEFRGMELEEVAACIEGEPEISSVKAEPGKTKSGHHGDFHGKYGVGGGEYLLRYPFLRQCAGEWREGTAYHKRGGAEGLLSGLSDTDERSILLCQNDFVTDGDGICQCGI